MNRLLLLPVALAALCACKKDPPAPVAPAAPASATQASRSGPSWPKGLCESLARIEIHRTRGSEPRRSATVALGADGVWMMEAPRKGEADPDALSRLRLAFDSPQLEPVQRPPVPGPPLRPEFELQLTWTSGKSGRVLTRQVPLGQPVPVAIEGVGEFTVLPVEFSTKVPDPADFLPPGLWVSAAASATSLSVSGPASYRLVRRGADWVSADGRPSMRDLDDFPAVITSRQSVGHPEGDLRSLGLSPPFATATLCAGERCREFKLGRVDEGGQTRYYGLAPGADPIELRASDAKLLAEGPWAKDKSSR